MKTAIIWSNFLNLPEYFIILGDHRKYHGITINLSEDDSELCDFMYDDGGERRYRSVSFEQFVSAVKNGAYVISCGEAP